MSIYHDVILDHYHYPHNKGVLQSPDAEGHVSNVLCGDSISIGLLIKDGHMEDIKFNGEGCAISTASASLLTDYVKGMPIEEVLNLTQSDVLKLLQVELTPTRLKCALVPLEAIHSALSTLMKAK